MKSSANALARGSQAALDKRHAQYTLATECGSQNNTIASKRDTMPDLDDCTLLPVQLTQGAEGPSPAKAQGPEGLTGRGRSWGQPGAVPGCPTWRGVRLMDWLLLHRPVGPALPPNSTF